MRLIDFRLTCTINDVLQMESMLIYAFVLFDHTV
jgi:hypothetical protein